jgi:hypothetical protein
MRKKHHIEIVMRDDGTTTCFVGNEGNAVPTTTATNADGSIAMATTPVPSASDAMVNILPVPLSELITSVSTISVPQVSHAQLSSPVR